MSGIELGLEAPPDFDLDMSALLPDALLPLSVDAVKRVRVAHGKRRVAVGDLFAVDAVDDAVLSFRASTPRLRRIGYGLGAGSIVVSGHAGDELGATMRGGDIRVKGNAGDYCGSDMRAGTITVSDSVGDFAGGALPSDALGMRGGVLCIGGDAGARTGERMRRGCIIVGGAAGAYAGANMIAGTIVVGGAIAAGCGIGMRRGTIVLFADRRRIPATFNDCGEYELAVMTLLQRYIARFDRRSAARLKDIRGVRRFVGDIGAGGQGEILLVQV